MSINRVILMGRLVADPELKTTGTGISVTSFRIAVDRSYAKQGEERKADFFDIVCWRGTAEFVCRYFGKGSLIALEGKLQSRTYQANDGSNRNITEIVADNVSFTGEKREQGNNQQYPAQQNYNPQSYERQLNPPQQALQQHFNQPSVQPQQGYQQTVFTDVPPDDDLPF